MTNFTKKLLFFIMALGFFAVVFKPDNALATIPWPNDGLSPVFKDGTNASGLLNGTSCESVVNKWISNRKYHLADYGIPGIDLIGNTAFGSDCAAYYLSTPSKSHPERDHNVTVIPLLDSNNRETGYGMRKDCENIVWYTPKAVPTNAWEIKTGSWSQAGATRAYPDSNWKPETTISETDNFIYFTHSAGLVKKEGEIGYPNSDKWKDAKSNITVSFSQLKYEYDNDGNPATPDVQLPPAEAAAFFGSTATCGPHSTPNWWSGEGWPIETATMPNLSTFTKTGTHWGIGPAAGAKNQNYLCEIELTKERKAAITAFGKKITITSTITIDPSVAQDASIPAGTVKGVGGNPKKGGPVSSSAKVIINLGNPSWAVNVMSYVKVDRNSGPTGAITGCDWGKWCAGKVGIGSSSVFTNIASRDPIDGPPTIITAESGCAKPDGTLGDASKCVDMDVNFRHVVKVSGKDTGTDKTKKQLWFYAISNENTQTDFSSNGCLGSSRSVNGGSRFKQKSPAVRWHSIVLEAGKTYDILSAGSPSAIASESSAKDLCANDIKNDKIKKGGWRSTLYLCFATGGKYNYKYGSETEIAADASSAQTACEQSLNAHSEDDSAWAAAGGTDGVVLTSHAVAGYQLEGPPKCDNDPSTVLPDCEKSEIAVSKTQTCAVNSALGHKCDPENTAPEKPGQPDEFKALDPTGKKTAITQLARPGDQIKFAHNFDKAAQKLNKDTSWKALPGFSPAKCQTAGAYNTSAGMPSTDKDCILVSGPAKPFETKISRSHGENEAKTGESAYKAEDAGENQTFSVQDDCFYTGREGMFPTPNTTNQGKLSFNSIKAPSSATLNSLQSNAIANQCAGMDGEGKLYEESAAAKVVNQDVGAKEIYQRATLFDRVAQKLSNIKNGAGKENYKTNSGAGATSQGEDSEHKYTVEWRRRYTCGSCTSGCCSDCSGCCCSSRTVWGGYASGNCASSSCSDGSQDSGAKTYTEWEHTWVDMVDAGPVSSNAQFNIPYNYQIIPKITATWPDNRMLHGGSELTYETWFDIQTITNTEFSQDYATLTRPDTHWEVTEFYIEEDVLSDPNPADRHDAYDPCSSYIHANNSIQNVNRNCYTKAAGTGSLNTIMGADHQGSNNAKNDDTAHRNLTAIINDAPAGTKFCIGVSIYDDKSYYGDDEDTYGDGLMNTRGKGNKWYHLKPECISISKVPTMQIWGGGLYAENQVTGKYVSKIPAPSLDYWQAFGSWSEYDAIGSDRLLGNHKAVLKTFGSAAAFGRGLDVGGVSNEHSIEGCDFAKLHFANADVKHSQLCQDPTPANKKMGNAKIFKGLAENIALRYTNRVQVPSGKAGRWVTGDTAKVDASPEQDFGDWNANGAIAPKDKEITYYRASGDATITETTIPAGKTVIVEVDGTAKIAGNIKYTDAALSSIYEIPQVLIFAANLDINPEVTQIDAWLMIGLKKGVSSKTVLSGQGVTTGEINTCATGIDEGSLIAANKVYQYNHGAAMPNENEVPEASRKCNSRLKINGPIQAQKLRLLRSHGGGMGTQCNYDYQDVIGATTYTSDNQAEWPNGGKYANCGSRWYGTGPFPYDSATPAEVLNLRADAYLWAYRQTENYSQAFVTYQREVAPRF